MLPGPDLMPLETISEMEQLGGFQLAQVPDMTGRALASTAPAPPVPNTLLSRDPGFVELWNRMDVELAQSILDTGNWDDIPATWMQMQVAHKFIQCHGHEGPKQVRLSEV